MDRIAALLQDVEDAICDDDYLIEQYTRIEGTTPLDIMLEKEKRKHIIKLLRFVLPKLSKKDRKILWMFAIKGASQLDISRKLRMSQPGILKRIDTMNKRIKGLTDNQEFIEWFEALLPPQSKEEAHAPETRGYPFEVMKMVSVASVKVKLDGIMHYRNKWECRMVEYLQKSFGDSETCCTLCENCSKVQNRKVRELSKVA